MTNEQQFYNAIIADPGNTGVRLAFSDWLEERGDPRAELVRLQEQLRAWGVELPPGRSAVEARMLASIAVGVKPIGPFMTNSIGMNFVLIPPVDFLMGNPGYAPVTLTAGFWLGKFQVTQTEFEQVLKINPSFFSRTKKALDVTDFDTSRFPVENVSWDQATRFCESLTFHDRSVGAIPSGWEYRLPTEAQWEYACRAGTTTPFGIGNGNSITSAHANFHRTIRNCECQARESSPATSRVGSYLSNGWGLCDMHGNVREWCQDVFRERLTGGTDPKAECAGPPGRRVSRGGGWRSKNQQCTSSRRSRYKPDYQDSALGFRVALVQARN